LEAKNRELDTKLREEQALREKAEMRNMDLRKKLREAKDEIKTSKQIGKKSREENDGSRKNTDSVSEKHGNQKIDSKEAKPPTAGKTPLKGKTASNPCTITGASPKKHASASDITLMTGSSHSHNIASQLASTPLTPKSKGSITNPSTNLPIYDLKPKEKSEVTNGTDGASRLIRSRSLVKETEPRIRGSTVEGSVASRSVKEKSEVSHRRVESMSTIATPPLMPPLRSQSHANGPKPSGHKHTRSLHDFDPLKSTVPVISFPTPLSLEALPIKTSSTSESVSLSHDLSNTYMSQNSLVMPVSFGMTPTAVRTTEGGIEQNSSPMAERQALVANNYHGLHEQQFMVVQQQQPIVFNQMAGRMQQQMVDSTYQTQQRSNTLQNNQYAGGSVQQQHMQHQPLQHHLQHQSHQHHTQHSSQQTYTNPAYSFDPFSR
jgi:hypothetical protein